MQLIRNSFEQSGKALRELEIMPSLLVFAAFIISAKLGQYIFFTQNTAPAILWAPTGIALAAVYLKGYRMWIPIAAAQFLVALTNPVPLAWAVILASTFAYTLQPLLGVYMLKRLGFEGRMLRTRDSLILIILSFLIPGIGPIIVGAVQLVTHTLPASLWASWSRNWAAGVLSILIFTPAITTWLEGGSKLGVPKRPLETVIAFVALTAWVYVVYWTNLPKENIFFILYILLALLFWIGLRLGPGAVAIALLINTAFGMAGSIIANPSALPLGQQLFADELFTILLAPIFLILSALVEERRISGNQLQETIRDLQTALSRLEAEDQSKNEFIAILAHELRNPLAPIVSTLELLKLGENSAEEMQLIESADGQTKVMRRLLDDLLDVARVTQKKFKLVKERVDLREIAKQCVSNAEALLRSRAHTLFVSLPQEPMWAVVDPVRIEQVVINLLNNAAKYTNKGGRIELSLALEESDIVIRVRDNGNGIPAAELENIFLPFKQIRPDPRLSSGLGIGLSLTKRLVEMHGGVIEVFSEGLGHGSTFTVRLPISVLAEDATIGKSQLKTKPTYMPRLKILVVDDNELAAQGIGRLLEHKGHIVSVAHNGADALQAAADSRPEVILLDIGLPDISGYQVATQIRKGGNDKVMLIALTGYGQDEDKFQAGNAGFNYHLTKPVSINDIERIISPAAVS